MATSAKKATTGAAPKADAETRLTRLEAAMRIVGRTLKNIETRIGEVHDDKALDALVNKTGGIGIRLAIGIFVLFVGGLVIAGTVTVPANQVSVWGYPAVGFIDSDGDLTVGGTVSAVSFVGSGTSTNTTLVVTGTSRQIGAVTMETSLTAISTNDATTNTIIDVNGTVPATSLSGNIAVARMTNGAATLGASIGGNIPVAAITNAAGSVGASIGGNIPVAALTNAFRTPGAIGGGTPAAIACTEATVDGKYATVGPDATTGLMIVAGGTCTNTEVVSYGVVFGTAPKVVLGGAESTATVPYPSSINTTNFTANGENSKTLNWIAIGARP